VTRARRAIATALLLLAGACGVPTDRAPRPIPADRVPFDLLDRQVTPPAPAPVSTP
jgi:hypothetical protein